MELVGQRCRQAKHRVQPISAQRGVPSIGVMVFVGHSSAHLPQWMQVGSVWNEAVGHGFSSLSKAADKRTPTGLRKWFQSGGQGIPWRR